MDEQSKEAAVLFSRLSDEGKANTWMYLIVLVVQDRLNDPELNRMNDEFQQRLKEGNLSQEEHVARVNGMIERVKELTKNDKSPLKGILRAS